ncbi:exonuclease V [Mycena latifolia]|nr:exonuclease V [Mycena latifolia]
MSEDEYDAYNDFAGLTEEDFARLDASYGVPDLPQTSQNHAGPSIISIEGEGDFACLDASSGGAGPPHPSQNLAGPSITIEVEGSLGENLAERRIPIQKYRRRGTLSVTDVISLAWCEVQFDYGLLQRRSRRLADRLPSFRLDSGKEIVVQQDVAARNDKTTKRGRVIHKELELALRPEEIEIVITGEEERWAFRLINFLSSLVSLDAEGCVREIPVFGIVNDVVIIGIIDELLVRTSAMPETGTKRASDSPLPSPKRLCQSPSPTELFPAAPTPPPQHSIRVIDTKTRRTNSLPSDEDTEPARLQVMLYHRLLTGLLDKAAPIDYSALWTRLDLDPYAPFSEVFIQQTAAILGGGDSLPTCLNDVVLLLRFRVAALGLPALDSMLEIIYRSQNKYSVQRHWGKDKGRATFLPTNREDEDIAKAIELSLADAFKADLATALKESALVDVPPAASAHLGDFNFHETPLENVQGPSNIPTGYSTPILNNEQRDEQQSIHNESAAPDDFLPPAQEAAASDIIGTKEFPMDDTLLDTYLTSALQWWQGARKARGVSERQTGRCFSCEYRNDCEWREQKAAEAALRYRSSEGAS